MRICLIGEDPVLVEHLRRLEGRHEVVVVSGADAARVEAERFDVAIADGWQTTARLFAVPAARYVRHVARLDHRALPPNSPDRIPAALALDLPLDFTAESDGLAAFLRTLRPGVRVAVVPPAAEPGAGQAALARNGVLRVAVAGDEGAGERVLGSMSEAHERVDGAGADVVVAVGEPREPARVALSAYAQGAALVMEDGPLAAGVVEHRESGLLVDPDDPAGAGRALDGLVRDRELAERLRAGAARRLADWPRADDAAAALERALEGFAAEPPPDDLRWPSRLLGDAIAHAAEVKAAIDAAWGGGIDLTNPLHAYAQKLEQELEAAKSAGGRRGLRGLRR